MNRLLGLELLRGVAALLVLLEHVRYSVRDIGGNGVEAPWVVSHFVGYWGVDVFFVLSGYLIALTIGKPGTTARSFLLARLARILPLYLVMSILCLAGQAAFSREITASTLVTTFTLMPLAGDAMNPRPAHLYGWTLCYEMMFYLVATALAAAVGGRRAVPALVTVFALGPLAFTAVGPVAGWAYPNFALSPLTAEFALGVLAYRLTASLPKWAGWALLALGVVGLMASCVAGRECGPQVRIIADPLLAWTRVGLFGVPAFACVLGTARLDHAGTFLPVARSATAAGAVSYSLYLAQPFAFAATALICIASGFTQPWPVAAVTVVSSLALAALAARYLDLPMHAVAKGWAKRLAAPTPVGAAMPALVLPSLGPRATR